MAVLTEDRASILSLPNETLLAIFQDVYEWTLISSPELVRWPPEDPHDLTLFPYSCAYVCRRWLDVLSMDEHFWTFIIIYLDTPHVTREVITTIIEASRENRISIFICYRGFPHMGPDLECERVEEAMECLKPHLSRCTSFNLKGLYRSSTILASRYLDGTSALGMVKMVLTSVIADTDDRFAVMTLDCPKLEWVDLDARSLADFTHEADGWRSHHSRSNVSFYATRYQPLSCLYPLSPTYFAEAMTTATSKGRDSFIIWDVEFAEEDPALPNSAEVGTRAAYGGELFTTFWDMGGPSISRLLDSLMYRVGPGGITISVNACTLTHFQLRNRLCAQSRLGLVDMKDLTSLYAILSQWDGSLLVVVSSAGFNDSFLRLLAENMELCPNLRTLVIDGCPWTSKSLCRMCKARDRAGNRIRDLDITGRVRRPNPRVLELLGSSVDELHWRDTYVIDGELESGGEDDLEEGEN